MTGPKKGYSSEGEDEHGGKWSYAGEPDLKGWEGSREHELEDKTHESEFEYRDSSEHNIHKPSDWPDYKEISQPEKE